MTANKDEGLYYSNDLFLVKKISFTDPMLGEELDGYGVFNISTGIREAELRRFFFARTLADRFEQELLSPKQQYEDSLVGGGSAGSGSNGARAH